MWKALGWIGEGWAGAKSCICKDLEQGIGYVTAAYVMCGAIFGGVSTLGSGAVFGGCTGGDD